MLKESRRSGRRWGRGASSAVEAWAAASIANGDLVTPGSVNGALVPFVASPATAGNPMRFFVGRALQNAGAGDRFAVLVDPGTSL